jgi:S-DNA-T family DNA segregation ATPase FtsK/SpoIIIE
VEGGLYRGLPHLQWPAELITDRGGLLVALRRLQEEMARRVTLFRTHGWRSLKEARARGEALPYIVLFLDELADVSGDAEIGAALEDLARKGRFAGIHLIAATQRPDAATFSGQLRANLSVRIALAVNKAAESRIILDEAGAELLPRPGELLARLQDAGGRGMVRLHGVWLEAEDVRSVVTRRGGGG